MSVYRHQGKWKYDFWKNNVRQQEGGFPTRAEAKASEAEARKNLKGTNLGFTKVCVSRLRELKKRRTRQYFNENKKLIKKLIVRWKDKKKIVREDIEQYLLETSTHFVANKELRFIKALFNHGIERDMLSENPAFKIKYFPIEKKKKYIPPAEDVEKVLNIVTEKQRLYLLAIICTLARVREINKLKWEDVHDDHLILRTRKAKNSDLTERKIPINSILKEKMKELPDANIAESIGRLPGISVQRNAGEADAVIIRGLAPKYNEITIEGFPMSSTYWGDRGVDLSLLGDDLVKGVEVSKTLRPDLQKCRSSLVID